MNRVQISEDLTEMFWGTATQERALGAVDRMAGVFAELDARLAALESPRAEPPQATGWPAPDCAAVAGEAFRVECHNCFKSATRIMLRLGNDAHVAYDIRPCCDEHEPSQPEHYITITGAPARAILNSIAREAARVRK